MAFEFNTCKLTDGTEIKGLYEIQPKIFEPFFTTKETGKGTGLGLAIAAQVVEDHRGTISVKSKPGSGSIFTVNLPRMYVPAEET